ncbi:MAG: NADP-specific glutamate dehydrogenase [Clostridiales bacterium 38_11]|nr:MAG: NADP-specific glutamate dehydrogenase [Clostridiales bacterium 38_11]HBH11522.1 NADP-specific glutamate dehydrogenase [Clostridiales bacterium]
MSYISRAIETAKSRNPGEIEFLQVVEEMFESIHTVVESNPKYEENAILERMLEPDRQILFRVTWVDDAGRVQVNRGYRVQFNNSIGPYKGGLRLHPSVNLSIMKSLAFEQVFKNSLTGLPIGGGKGGSDFDPKGKSEREIMRFCQNFMIELSRYLGHNLDVPAGDIGVGMREIGYLFGQYKRIKNVFEPSVITGKNINYGGSLVRKEATGYGLIYYVREMLKDNGESFEGKNVIISGSGNVAIYACEKAQQYGANIIAMCDSDGYVYDKDGIDLETMKRIKERDRKRISEYIIDHPNAEYYSGQKGIFSLKCDIALPCATQYDIGIEDAAKLKNNGCFVIGEGANMPCTNEATAYLLENGFLIAASKAANAGGVATSALEMSQNNMGLYWDFSEVNEKLDHIMVNIFNTTKKAATNYGFDKNYSAGANIASFLKISDVMLNHGIF